MSGNKKNPKVALAIPSTHGLSKDYQSMINSLDYSNKEVFVAEGVGDEIEHLNKNFIYAVKCASMRERARQKALKSDAEYILFLNDDVFMPSNTIKELLWMKQPVCAAWVASKNKAYYLAGTWKWDKLLGKRCFEHCMKPLIEPDQTTPFISLLCNLACSLWIRELAELVPIRCDFNAKNFLLSVKPRARRAFSSDSTCAGYDLQQLGVMTAMSTRVVCEHRHIFL